MHHANVLRLFKLQLCYNKYMNKESNGGQAAGEHAETPVQQMQEVSSCSFTTHHMNVVQNRKLEQNTHYSSAPVRHDGTSEREHLLCSKETFP